MQASSSAVLVVGGEEVGANELDHAGAMLELERLVELAHAPFEHGRDGVGACGIVQRERLAQVLPDQLALLVAGQLEDAAPDGEDAGVAVAREHAGARPGIEVVEQLEHEAEAAARATDGLMGQAVAPVGVHRAQAAVGADEVRHRRSKTRAAARARPPI